MKKDTKNVVAFAIDGYKLDKSPFADVKIIECIPPEKNPYHKWCLTVDYITRQTIIGDTEEKVSKLINDYLESKGE